MSENKNYHKTSVGGQALIEGVMMQGPRGMATAVRNTNGEIITKYHEFHSLRKKYKFFNLPIIRGIVAFFESMIIGYRVLTYSAEASGLEDMEDVEMNKFEKWLTDKLGDKFMDVVMFIGSLLGFALAFLIFFYLPVLIFKLVNDATGGYITAWQGVIEGMIKIIIFVTYMLAISKMKDINRLFKYHGAEHKSIACYESGQELTVENVKKCTRFHPRCGTSFIFVMLILGMVIVSLLSLVVPEDIKSQTWLWMLIKLPCIPIVMGIGYEFIKYAGTHDNMLVKILSAPGLWMQRITTKEPDDDIIECGIASIKAVITDNPEDDELK